MSSRPIKDGRSCPRAGKLVGRSNQRLDTPISSHATFTASFPSPQEFEFAKEIHDSPPASPISPPHTQQSESKSDALDAHSSSPICVTQANDLVTERILSRSSLSGSCSNPKRHPLHTYILPALCSTCQQARLENIARFEAQTIKESVEREDGMGLGRSRGGVIDSPRTKIKRQSAAVRNKGLIPLICVEEGRIKKLEWEESASVQERAEPEQQEAANENISVEGKESGRVQEHTVAAVVASESVEDTMPVGEERMEPRPQDVSATNVEWNKTNNVWTWWSKQASVPPRQLSATITAVQDTDHGAGMAQQDEARQDSRNLDQIATGAAPTTAAPPGWSWWGRNASSLPAGVPKKEEPQASVPTADQGRRNLGHKKTLSRFGRMSSRPLSPKVDVAWDTFGRNVKGMNRIMGWDTGGALQGS